MTDERDIIDPDDIAEVERTEVRIRRAPRLWVFAVIGALLVELVTVIVTLQFKPDPAVGMTATLGYLSIYGLLAGATLGLVVGLLLDALSRRLARTVEAERAVLVERSAESDAGAAAAETGSGSAALAAGTEAGAKPDAAATDAEPAPARREP